MNERKYHPDAAPIFDWINKEEAYMQAEKGVNPIHTPVVNQLIPFDFENKQTRIIVQGDEVWFVAQDVVRALDYPNSRDTASLCKKIPEEWAGMKRIHTRSKNGVMQDRDMLCLSEQGLYFFLGRSDKPKALPFQKKVAGEILPQIRKTGGYSAAGQTVDLADVNTFIKESVPRIRFLISENYRLQRMNRLYEEKERLREQIARKNTPLTESEKRQILACATQWSVAEIARYTNRSETAIRRVLKGMH